MIASRSDGRPVRAARAVIGVAVAGLLAVGAAVTLVPDADAVTSARANSVKVSARANSV